MPYNMSGGGERGEGKKKGKNCYVEKLTSKTQGCINRMP
jgi:hypothetical protein